MLSARGTVLHKKDPISNLQASQSGKKDIRQIFINTFKGAQCFEGKMYRECI